MAIVKGEVNRCHAVEALANFILQNVVATLNQCLHQEVKEWIQEGCPKLELKCAMDQQRGS